MHSPTPLGLTAQQPNPGTRLAGSLPLQGDEVALEATEAPTFTLRFTEWRCGHHGQRPADIPCQSVEQAQLILQAIGHAMSEPGNAVAALFDHRASFDGIHICADHADAIEPDANLWGWRSNVYCLTAEQFAALQTPEMKAAQLDRSGEPLPIWDGKTYLDDFEYITLLSPEEVQALCKPVEWHEVGERSAICSAPPIIENGDWLASEIKDFADIRASKVGAS